MPKTQGYQIAQRVIHLIALHNPLERPLVEEGILPVLAAILWLTSAKTLRAEEANPTIYFYSSTHLGHIPKRFINP